MPTAPDVILNEEPEDDVQQQQKESVKQVDDGDSDFYTYKFEGTQTDDKSAKVEVRCTICFKKSFNALGYITQVKSGKTVFLKGKWRKQGQIKLNGENIVYTGNLKGKPDSEDPFDMEGLFEGETSGKFDLKGKLFDAFADEILESHQKKYETQGSQSSPEKKQEPVQKKEPTQKKESISSSTVKSQLIGDEHRSLHEQKGGTKNAIHKAIQADDLAKITSLFDDNHVAPNEEISVAGNFWTAMHYAAHFNKPRMITFLMQELYYQCQSNVDTFKTIMQGTTKDGWTPAMIAAIYKCDVALEKFFQLGGIDLNAKDNLGQTIGDVASKYGATACKQRYQTALSANKSGWIEPNVKLLSQDITTEEKKAGGGGSSSGVGHLKGDAHFTVHLQNGTTKNHSHKFIQNDDLAGLQDIFKKNNVAPNEELSVAGNFWTALHYAAHFNKPKIVEWLIKEQYRQDKDSFRQTMNCTTKDGWTPAMIAAIYKCDAALEVFLRLGGTDLAAKDNNSQTIGGVAQKYGATTCKQKFEAAVSKYGSTYIPPQF